MKHAATRMLFSYWDALRGERAAPDRGEIEPGEIRHILADTFILENEDGPARFRLAGTRLCALFGCELKNAPFSAIWDPATPDDGARQIVFVARGEGLFEPRDVRLGARAGADVEIREGLTAGEEIVTSGIFLIDAESNLQTALSAFTAEPVAP